MNIVCKTCLNKLDIKQTGPQVDAVCHCCNSMITKFIRGRKKKDFSSLLNKDKENKKVA